MGTVRSVHPDVDEIDVSLLDLVVEAGVPPSRGHPSNQTLVRDGTVRSDRSNCLIADGLCRGGREKRVIDGCV